MLILWIALHCMVLILLSNQSTADIRTDPITYILLTEDLASENMTHGLQRHKRAVDGYAVYTYDIDIQIDIQPDKIPQLMELFHTLPYPLPVNNFSVEIGNISSAAISTECNDTVCICENGYLWGPEICRTQACSITTVQLSCDCITNTSTDGVCEPVVPTTTTTTPKTNRTTSTTTTTISTTTTTTVTTTTLPTTTLSPTAIVLSMTVKIIQDFDAKLLDKSSDMYKKYEDDFKKGLTKTYENVTGFYAVNILGFKNGSILVDYEAIIEQNAVSQIVISTSGLKSNLIGYLVDSTSATSKIQANVTVTSTSEAVSVGDFFTLKCQAKVTLTGYNVKWFFNNIKMNSTLNSISLTLTALPSSGGIYGCQFYLGQVTTDLGSIAIRLIPLPTYMKIYPGNLVFICNTEVALNCCVPYDATASYSVTLKRGSSEILNGKTTTENGQLCNSFAFPTNDCETEVVECVCTNTNGKSISQTSNITYIKVPAFSEQHCQDQIFGYGTEGSTAQAPCDAGQVGNMTATCISQKWIQFAYSCVSAKLQSVLDSAQTLENDPLPYEIKVPNLLGTLADQSSTFTSNSQTTVGNINAVVTILNAVSNAPINNVSVTSMKSVMKSVDVVVGSTDSWSNVSKSNPNASSDLLHSVEKFAKILSPDSQEVNISYANIELRGITLSSNDSAQGFNKSFQNNTASVVISPQQLSNLHNGSLIIGIGYSTLGNILFDKNNGSNGNFSINGILITVTVNGSLNKLEMTFQKTNASLNLTKCVFWNFITSLWDDFGCSGKNQAENVICTCNHTTSFSVLMSLGSMNAQDQISVILEWITYIGVGISMGSLVICLIIEGIVWKSVTKNKTSFMRHVCIVNIAVSLLIADTWFIIDASISSNETIPDQKLAACKTTTFFVHYFYLSLFFWMLVMGLILFYRLVLVFHDMSRSTMMAFAFTIGYGCPLLITIITIAVTEPKNNYIRKDACWLNWDPSRALLAFVIPALIIFALNLMILFVVIVRLLQSSTRDRSRTEEKSTLIKVGRSVAILTPILGLTWGFGIGTVTNRDSEALQVIFTVLNALQGFFVLIFGTLLDKKIRDALFQKVGLERWTSQPTQTTSSANSGGPVSRILYNMFGKKGKYMVSGAKDTSSKSSSQLFSSDSYSVLS